jgi:hypothetical protein
MRGNEETMMSIQEPQATRETKRVKRNARTGLIEETVTDTRTISATNAPPLEIHIERVAIAADGSVGVSLTEFDGTANFTWQQLGELVGQIAALTWREAARVASPAS